LKKGAKRGLTLTVEVDGCRRRQFKGGGRVSGCRQLMVDGGSTMSDVTVDEENLAGLMKICRGMEACICKDTQIYNFLIKK
jgi:hypothetical protein